MVCGWMPRWLDGHVPAAVIVVEGMKTERLGVVAQLKVISKAFNINASLRSRRWRIVGTTQLCCAPRQYVWAIPRAYQLVQIYPLSRESRAIHPPDPICNRHMVEHGF